ncbi:unnamed protein product [Cladocopium goreaui]|uniref:JmjC domain-containing protein 7 n=1 Tax=Cladocopium goreaui TaxID=2562237 RepID=A0A9P1FP98_9DINO|nr:unnamed protein product [Cladocopium goreaui]
MPWAMDAMDAMDREKKARLASNIRDFWLPPVIPRRRFEDVTALEFLRDYVSMSQPVVLTDLPSAQWPCFDRWTEQFLLSTLGPSLVSVNVTPDGRADAVRGLEAAHGGRCFAKPLEERMSFQEFWKSLSGSDEVHYLSRQNDSLREEFPALLEENFYVVVRGEKIFTLLPPASAPFLHESHFPSATYRRTTDGQLEAVLDEGDPDATSLPWIPFDVCDVHVAESFPDFAEFGASLALDVSVKERELLYLPAMWYHRVAQKGVTIAVNYWHDMQIGHAYLHHQFLRDAFGMDTFPESES